MIPFPLIKKIKEKKKKTKHIAVVDSVGPAPIHPNPKCLKFWIRRIYFKIQNNMAASKMDPIKQLYPSTLVFFFFYGINPSYLDAFLEVHMRKYSSSSSSS